MNLILIDPTEQQLDGTVILEDRRADHIITILRCNKGDEIKIGIVNGPIGSGRILETTAGRVVLQIKAEGPEPPPPLNDLILALPRPIMLKRMLAQAAVLGVGKIYIIKANRVEKSYFHSSLLVEKNFRSYLLQGLEQAMDTQLPEVTVHSRFRPFAEDILPAIMQDYEVGLIGHPNAEQTLPQTAPPPFTGRSLLAVGPEGGWVDFEIKKFREAGMKPFTLGPRILRTDMALPALFAQIDLLRNLYEG